MKDKRESIASLTTRGFVVALPTLLLGLALSKFYQLVAGGIRPLLEVMPGTVFHDQAVRFVVVLVVFAGILSVIGWLAQTWFGRRIGRWLEMALLSRLPFYNVVRTLASGLLGHEDASCMQAALISVDAPGLDQLGFIVDRFADGRAAVYLPSSPNPGSGTVVIVAASRFQVLHVPMRRILQCLGQWGRGAAGLLEVRSGAAEASEPLACPHGPDAGAPRTWPQQGGK